MSATPKAILVVDHLWRPPIRSKLLRSHGPWLERPCEFMNCGRPRAEHERATAGWWRR